MKLKNVLLLLSIFSFSLIGLSQTTDTPVKATYHLMPAISGGEFITLTDLENLSETVVLQATVGNYELSSFMVIIVPKYDEVRVYNVEGNILPPGLLADIKIRNEGCRLLIDQVKAKERTTGETIYLAPSLYTIIGPNFKNSFIIGSEETSGKPSEMRKKHLAYMGNAIKIASKLEEDHDLLGFTLTLIPNNDDILATSYQVTRSALSNELLEKIKALPVGSTIIFHDIRIAFKAADSASKILSPTKYTIIE